MGGMEKLMEELEKRGGMSRLPNPGPDKFFESSMKALAPVSKKNEGSTALVLIGDKLAALGTVISANGRILTKNTETQKGKLSIRLGDKRYDAKVLKRVPERDLALLKIDAEELHPVRFQAEEPPLGSILTATGAKDEPLGIGLLSVPGRAMAKVGFIGIQAGESDKGVLIQKALPKGAASEAGLKDNDVITHIDGKKVDDHVEFGHLIRGRKAGEAIKVQYLRDGKAGKATATLKERAMRDNARDDPRMKMSHGELSEKTSGYPDAIQHDIPLPPQLCGGPLFDLKGRCIGINVSRAGRTKTYAIPADEIQAMLKSAKGPKKPVAKNENLEAIKAIRESLKEIEKRLEELEKAER
jgi:serine protease Do